MDEGLRHRLLLGITTKNRQADLSLTLADLERKGNVDFPILVVDDGSQPPLHLPETKLEVQLVRFEESKGLIARRNWMVQQSTEPYFLSLDDDSTFRDHVLLIPCWQKWMETLPSSPSPSNIDGSELPMWPEDWPEGEVSHFTGCGHLLRRSTFLELGGYREPFVHMCEEIDFGLRAVGAGFRILGLPAVVVSHRITLQARSNSRNWFLRSATSRAPGG
jgi:glycosyltransferase involved in cell wall biosynthesis